MKIAITLKDFIDAFLRGPRAFITVTRHGDGDHFCFPTNHAWAFPHTINQKTSDGRSKYAIKKEFDRMMQNSQIKDGIRALAFIDDEFNADEEYGEYANWYVWCVYPSSFINPIANTLDETLEIIITPPNPHIESEEE